MCRCDGMSEVAGKICDNPGADIKALSTNLEMCVPGTAPSFPTSDLTLKVEGPAMKIFTMLGCMLCQIVAQKF